MDTKLSFNELPKIIHEIETEKGFWPRLFPFKFRIWKRIPEKLSLIHSEVSEALEHYRNRRDSEIGEELADIIIRSLDLAKALKIDIESEIAIKVDKNMMRPYKHGKRC